MPNPLPQNYWLFSLPVIVILISHYVVDIYSSIIPPLIGVVETEYGMTSGMAALLLGIGSICSGLSQPLFAWISDRTHSRIYGPAGVFLGGIGICLIGFSNSIGLVFTLYAIGMMGIGMFHPIATAKIGSIAGQQRSLAISLFFVFGMLGFFTGSLVGPNISVGENSLRNLKFLIIPGLVMTVALQMNINVKVKGAESQINQANYTLSDYDWSSLIMLYLSAVFRFLVNMAVIYLIVRWVESYVASQDPVLSSKEISRIAAPIAGKAHAIMFVGQAIGGLAAGWKVTMGREKLPLVYTPIVFTPFLIILAFIQPGPLAYVCCFFGGIGFSAMTPITISVGQQLMPSHTRLASGLMLGGAWALGSIGPRFSQWVIDAFNLQTAIVTIGFTLVLSGLLATGVKLERLPSK